MSSTNGTTNFKRSMNGIASFGDGSGTDISNGNINCNTLTINNQAFCPVAPNSSASLTNKSYVDVSLTTAGSNYVNLFSEQFIDGIKHFYVVPQCNVSPTISFELSNKYYVDTQIILALVNYVKLFSDQTIDGIKSFSSVPICGTQPTTSTQLTNKSYVDLLDGANVKLTTTQTIAGSKTFSAPIICDTISSGTTYATSSLFSNNTSGIINIAQGNTALAGGVYYGNIGTYNYMAGMLIRANSINCLTLTNPIYIGNNQQSGGDINIGSTSVNVNLIGLCNIAKVDALHFIECATGSGVAYMDFHTNNTSLNDYDARIIVTGGNASSGQGAMQIQSATLTIPNSLYSANITATANLLQSHTGPIYIGASSTSLLGVSNNLQSNNSAAVFNIGTNQTNDINLGNQGTANNVNVWTLVPKSIYMPSGSITLASNTSTTAFKAFSGGVDISGPNGFIKLRGIYTRAGVSNNTVTTNLYNYYWDGFRMYCFVDDVNVGNSYSDYRCKENITKPQPILDRLCSIDMINYNYTKMGILDGKGNTFLGYYAHKLQEEFPEYETFVNGTKDEVNDDGTPKLQTINDITPLLMKAIQELKAEVDALKAQVSQLQGK